MSRAVVATLERWPLKEAFSISRYTFVDSLVATIRVTDESGLSGAGECEPHECDEVTANGVLSNAGLSMHAASHPDWLDGLTRENLGERLPRTPTRNGIDCALWDLEAKRRGSSAAQLAGFPNAPVPVMPTLGIDAPDAMAKRAAAYAGARWMKVKLGANDNRDEERLQAVAAAAPDATLLVDANGGWTPAALARMLPLCRRLNVRIIEQPMKPELDASLPKPPGDILFCADESCLDRESLAAVRERYQFINIKLDKAGGLTEALALRREAQRTGLGVMVGMMSGTSLAVAPAFVLAQGLEVVDLEVGFLLRDREPAMAIRDFFLQPPDALLWG